MPIPLSEPSPLWLSSWDNIRTSLAFALHAIQIVNIEHVGSTSIPLLIAKPVIDIDIVVSEASVIPLIIPPLQNIGYIYCGENGIPDRHFFRYNAGPDEMERNVYVVLEGSTALKNHLAVREVLRHNKDLREEYARVKKGLAETFDDVNKYCEAKTAFLLKVLRKAGLSEIELEEVRKSNIL